MEYARTEEYVGRTVMVTETVTRGDQTFEREVTDHQYETVDGEWVSGASLPHEMQPGKAGMVNVITDMSGLKMITRHMVREDGSTEDFHEVPLDDVPEDVLAAYEAKQARKARVAEHGFDPEQPPTQFAVIHRAAE